MNRRHAVKNLAIASGGLISLPFWMTACGISDKPTHLSSFSPAEQALLAYITDTIIPAGAGAPGTPVSPGTSVSPGALSVGVDKFLQKLIDDCYEKPAQDKVKQQLSAVDAAAKAGYGRSFADSTLQQRQAVLLGFAGSTDKDRKDFFDSMKSETIRGFNTSQQVMGGYLHYQVAPGHYYGCVNVKG